MTLVNEMGDLLQSCMSSAEPNEMALFPDHGTTPEEVLRGADATMYRAKERGRDRVAAASE